jgi:hypothetical protein
MDYELGFRALKDCLSGKGAATLAEAATLEGRFRDNERSEGLFGPSETTRSTRAQVVYALNQLALAHCGQSFNELCEATPDELAGQADTARTTQPPPDLADLHIDPDDPPYGALRALLAEAFLPEELRRFCLERKAFRPVVGRFGTGHGLDDMIDELFDYCRTRLLWDELLAEVTRDRPEQVARFADRLRS